MESNKRKLEDDKGILNSLLEGAKRQSENTKKSLEREHQQTLKKINVSYIADYWLYFYY